MAMKNSNPIGLRRRIANLFNTKGFSDVNVLYETGPETDDGTIGKMFYAKICAVKEGVPLQLDVVVKCAPVDDTFRQTMPIRNLFLREILFYNKIIPTYDDLQDQFELCLPREMRFFFPKSYGTLDDMKQETLVLEDLTKMGFRGTPMQTLDYDHAGIILRSIAKLHALSFICEERNPKRFKEIIDHCPTLLGVTTEEFGEKWLYEHGEKIVKQFTDAITDKSLRKRCKIAIGTNALDKAKEIHTSGKVMAIIHGDSWQCNYMFKYKNGEPSEAAAIDFQWSRYGSIAYDIMYLFGFSVSGELRSKYFYQLIEEYYATFKRFLMLCGYDADKFCTYEQLKEEVKSQACISIVSFMVATPFFKNPGLTIPELFSASEIAYAVTEEYKLSVNNLVMDWANFGFI